MPPKLVRQRTQVGKKSGPRYKRVPVYRSKAFRKKRMKQNAIFKETKSRTDEQVQQRFGHGAAYFNQIPTEFHTWPTLGLAGGKVFPLKMYSLDSQVQGTDDDTMVGQSLFSKYLKMKLTLRFPESLNVPQDQPNVYIIHGFITTSPNLNGHNTVQGTNDPSTWDTQKDFDWLRTELQAYMDQKEDRLQYIPKRESNIKILGYHRVRAKQREGFGRQRTTAVQFGDPTNTVLSVGTLMDYHRSLTWPMMRKIHYDQGLAGIFATQPGLVRSNNMFINTNQWRPFACLFCPELGADGGLNPPITVDNLPTVAYNSIHYYTDLSSYKNILISLLEVIYTNQSNPDLYVWGH